jgi:hypothetical protein
MTEDTTIPMMMPINAPNIKFLALMLTISNQHKIQIFIEALLIETTGCYA